MWTFRIMMMRYFARITQKCAGKHLNLDSFAQKLIDLNKLQKGRKKRCFFWETAHVSWHWRYTQYYKFASFEQQFWYYLESSILLFDIFYLKYKKKTFQTIQKSTLTSPHEFKIAVRHWTTAFINEKCNSVSPREQVIQATCDQLDPPRAALVVASI